MADIGKLSEKQQEIIGKTEAKTDELNWSDNNTSKDSRDEYYEEKYNTEVAVNYPTLVARKARFIEGGACQ